MGSRVKLKENTTVNSMADTLALISLKLAEFKCLSEIRLQKKFSLEEKWALDELYKLANSHWTSDDPDLGNMFDPRELKPEHGDSGE